jgi:hypothetical protein
MAKAGNTEDDGEHPPTGRARSTVQIKFRNYRHIERDNQSEVFHTMAETLLDRHPSGF